MPTLNEMAQLWDSEYGWPWLRHGLKLLHWFANKQLDFDDDNEMYVRCNPKRGDYGFHPFNNRHEIHGYSLLPEEGFRYYELGNLSKPGAHRLPRRIRRDYTGDEDDTNMDRIVIGLEGRRRVRKVYVTEHNDHSHYNLNATYCISRGLLTMIRRLTLEELLEQMDYSQAKS